MFCNHRIYSGIIGGIMAFSGGGAATGALGGAATGATLGSIFPGIGTAIGAGVGGLAGLLGGGFGGGAEEKQAQRNAKIRNQSLLRPQQEPLFDQAVGAGLGSGAGGAFGTAADYYRNQLSDEDSDADAFAAPELRRFREEIVPELSEQFAGMGAGGLSSSGFRNAALNAGTSLAERIGALRANLRQQSAQGLSNIGQVGLGQFGENVRNTPQPGFWSGAAQGVGEAAPSYLNSLGNSSNKSNSPYASGNNISASPTFSSSLPSFSNNPNNQRFSMTGGNG